MAEPPTMTVTLLGTGSPVPSPERFSQSTLVEPAGQLLLIDCGRGVVTRLFEAGIELGQGGPLFLTQLHSDHLVGIPDLWITGWFLPRPGARATPFRVYGPAGTADMMRNLEAGSTVDRHVRTTFELNHPDGARYVATDVDEGLVYDDNGIRVEAIRVAHWPHEDAPHALSYRVSYGGRSAVFSGDTAPAPRPAEFARGADLLVHEVLVTPMPDAEETAIRHAPDPERRLDVIMSFHTSPREAGRIFGMAAPKLAV